VEIAHSIRELHLQESEKDDERLSNLVHARVGITLNDVPHPIESQHTSSHSPNRDRTRGFRFGLRES
jgi:hypothetical protein